MPNFNQGLLEEKWLYNSQGKPIAFINSNGDKVYSYDGRFIGRLIGDRVMNGGYIGEVVMGDYIFRNIYEPVNIPVDFLEEMPNVPVFPRYRGSWISLPYNYSDIVIGPSFFE